MGISSAFPLYPPKDYRTHGRKDLLKRFLGGKYELVLLNYSLSLRVVISRQRQNAFLVELVCFGVTAAGSWSPVFYFFLWKKWLQCLVVQLIPPVRGVVQTLSITI